MKLIRVYEFGGPEVMQYEDAPEPYPAPGMVRVKVEAIGLNYIDTYQRSGAYKIPLPFTPGSEAAGVVDAVGQDVTDFKPGDRVAYALVNGAYAEKTIVAAEKLVPVPKGLDALTAAAAMLQGMTAHYLVNDTFPLSEGHTALIHAAAGGTGQLVVQMAKQRGARVIGTAGTEAKAALAKALGADEVIVYTQQDFEAEVKRLTDNKGVDVVYDSVGKDTFDKSLNCLRLRGMLVLFGQASGAVAPLDPQVLNAKGSLFLTRPSLGHYIATREELLRRATAVFDGIQSGALKIEIGRTFKLADAAEAHKALTGRQTTGKVLLTP
ncbi:MAG TPA: quinone oxidoreductase [Phototrophicaceae bacterium]|nr:quinone oxidoreductase [Phototrophicaceae bacterium]